MKPKISIKDFDYDLPDEKIARYPLDYRDRSKLLVYDQCKSIFSTHFYNISDHLPDNSLILFNNTKVIRARLLFKKHTGARIEIFCLEPVNETDMQLAMAQEHETSWLCIVGNLKKWKYGRLESQIVYKGSTLNVYAERIKSFGDAHHIRFSWSEKNLTFGEIIELIGNTPIPPYLNRNSEPIDINRYQTVYSKYQGSVAAPTAGLHFTDEIIDSFKNKNIETAFLTLHVGAGTFKPIKSETIDEHEMHVEHFAIEKKTIEKILNHTGPIIAVGTTTTRTLESLYWLGIKIQNGDYNFNLKQWESYEVDSKLSFKEALDYIYNYLVKNDSAYFTASTGIMIVPGYKFRAINGLITNFHQPRSTLLLLLAAFVGANWKKIYDYALNNNYRFLSYGDSSLLFK